MLVLLTRRELGMGANMSTALTYKAMQQALTKFRDSLLHCFISQSCGHVPQE